jgi:hypothetical protein
MGDRQSVAIGPYDRRPPNKRFHIYTRFDGVAWTEEEVSAIRALVKEYNIKQRLIRKVHTDVSRPDVIIVSGYHLPRAVVIGKVKHNAFTFSSAKGIHSKKLPFLIQL